MSNNACALFIISLNVKRAPGVYRKPTCLYFDTPPGRDQDSLFAGFCWEPISSTGKPSSPTNKPLYPKVAQYEDKVAPKYWLLALQEVPPSVSHLRQDFSRSNY